VIGFEDYMFGFIFTGSDPSYYHFTLVIPSFPSPSIISKDHLFPPCDIKIESFLSQIDINIQRERVFCG
jgi:hypothetical protein